MNDLNTLACDTQNSHLTAQCREKAHTVAGPEFGSEQGSVMLVKRALHGLKLSGAAFRSHLVKTVWDLGHQPTKANPDVWLKPAVKASGFKCDEMVLCYVDDAIAMSEHPMQTIKGIKATFKLKGDEVEALEMCLGGDIKQVDTGSDAKCWTLSLEK